MNFADLYCFVNNFEFKDVNLAYHPLIQKKYQILRDIGTVTKNFKDSWMIATVDDILLFYDEIKKDKGKYYNCFVYNNLY